MKKITSLCIVFLIVSASLLAADRDPKEEKKTVEVPVKTTERPTALDIPAPDPNHGQEKQ